MNRERRYIPETPDDIFRTARPRDDDDDNWLGKNDDVIPSVSSKQPKNSPRKVFAEHSLFIRALVHRLTEVRKAEKLWLKEGATEGLFHLVSTEVESITVDVLRKANALTVRGKPLDENIEHVRNLLEELPGTMDQNQEHEEEHKVSNRLQLPLTPSGAFPVWPFRTETAGCAPNELIISKATKLPEEEYSDVFSVSQGTNRQEEQDTFFRDDVIEFNRQMKLDYEKISLADADSIDLFQYEGCVSWIEYVVRLVCELLASSYEDYVLVGLQTVNVLCAYVVSRLIQQVVSYSNGDIEAACMLLDQAIVSADPAAEGEGKQGCANISDGQVSTYRGICRNIHQLRVTWVYLDRLDEPLQKCRGYGGNVLKQVNELLEKLRNSRKKVQHLLWTSDD